MTASEHISPVAIVTGGSRGFGRAVAAALLERAWTVVTDARRAADLDATAAELASRRLITIPGDVTEPAHRAALVVAAIDAGPLRLLVNNASRLGPSPQPRLADYLAADLRAVYTTNVFAPLALIQAALPALTGNGGGIVNITSDAAVEPYEGWGGYGSSKAALDHLSAILAAENPAIGVYAFDPGDMRTEMHQAAFPGEDISDRAEPESVVPALLRLLDTRPASGRYRAQRPARRRSRRMTSPYPSGGWAPSLRGSPPAEAAHAFRAPTRLRCRRATGGARCRPRRRQADGRHAAWHRARAVRRPRRAPRPGDLLVVNNSATLPAAVTGARAKRGPIAVHFSAALDDHVWVVELRPATNATGHLPDVEPGERIALPDGAALVVIASYPQAGVTGSRLWTARLAIEGDVTSYLNRHGRPIRYSYVPRPWPLSSYQTVFARRPGSAEMASAARPFSAELVTSLVSAGIVIAPITLHAGVSSAEQGEPPAAEPFEVPPATARLVELTRASGGRVIAVGTTATRAAGVRRRSRRHSAPRDRLDGSGPRAGRPPRVVDGLITGWHDAGASHLLLLEAVAGPALVAAAYREAIAHGYLWHEFGDSALLLPNPPRSR